MSGCTPETNIINIVSQLYFNKKKENDCTGTGYKFVEYCLP